MWLYLKEVTSLCMPWRKMGRAVEELYTFLTFRLDGVEWVAILPCCCFHPGERVPIMQWIGGCEGLGAGLLTVEDKVPCLCREIEFWILCCSFDSLVICNLRSSLCCIMTGRIKMLTNIIGSSDTLRIQGLFCCINVWPV